MSDLDIQRVASLGSTMIHSVGCDPMIPAGRAVKLTAEGVWQLATPAGVATGLTLSELFSDEAIQEGPEEMTLGLPEPTRKVAVAGEVQVDTQVQEGLGYFISDGGALKPFDPSMTDGEHCLVAHAASSDVLALRFAVG